ncbi:hypothetical protein E2C01_041318 [Portunus trituberculatus]|uniref:Uncharacterized protein n=1 Tax=Portunus trituberculatus TaxID=210409 RepID=A0A5B7FRL0_PORTR|nr:hypothetical protein [Portunus trituberculatus]
MNKITRPVTEGVKLIISGSFLATDPKPQQLLRSGTGVASRLLESPDLLPYTADVETMPILQETQLSSG